MGNCGACACTTTVLFTSARGCIGDGDPDILLKIRRCSPVIHSRVARIELARRLGVSPDDLVLSQSRILPRSAALRAGGTYVLAYDCLIARTAAHCA